MSMSMIVKFKTSPPKSSKYRAKDSVGRHLHQLKTNFISLTLYRELIEILIWKFKISPIECYRRILHDFILQGFNLNFIYMLKIKIEMG